MDTSKYDILDAIEIPADVQDAWQETLDILAQVIGVPAALIMRVHPREIEVFALSSNDDNVYEKNELAPLDTGLYCETVMDTREELHIPDALADPDWEANPDVKLGMTSYLGLPLTWPTGEIFGTICILDRGPHAYSDLERKVLEQFQRLIMGNLANVFENHEAGKRSRQALIKTLDRLTQSLAELERISYIASHDLQEPARSVVTHAQLLSKRYQEHLDDEGHEHLGYLVDGARRMSALVKDLVSYSRVTERHTAFQSVDMASLKEKVFEDIESLIEETGGSVEFGEVPAFTGDPMLLRELFHHLVCNGLKFHRPGVVPEVNIKAHDDGAEVLFSVCDNGIGIEADYKDKVFDIFARLHAGKAYPGTGIGLAICKRIVERHGGRIWVDSEPGEWSCFRFILPRG